MRGHSVLDISLRVDDRTVCDRRALPGASRIGQRRLRLRRSLDLYDDIGFCDECKVPYCDIHWSVSATGYGTCPKGHGKSLDPHWSP